MKDIKFGEALRFPTRIGDPVTSEEIAGVTGTDPEDVPAGTSMLQSDHCFASDVLGNTRLFETYTRESMNDVWRYAGLCEKHGTVNRHPECARRMFIISPYRADPDFCTKLARAICYEQFTLGNLPIAPHLYFPQFLREDAADGYEREYGITAGHEIMKRCDGVLVYIIGSLISEGMRSDIDFAINQLAIQPEYVKMTKAEAEEFIKRHLAEE